LKTEIPKLDELLNGGLRTGSSTLIVSTPGVKSLQFLYNLIYNRLRKNDKIVYVVNNKKSVLIKKLFKEYDWDITKFEKNGKFKIVDLYDGIVKKADQSKVQKSLLDSVKRLRPGTVLVIDSVSSFLDVYGANKKTVSFLKELLSACKKLTVVGLLTEWSYQKKMMADMRSFFDCVIDLETIEKNVILRSYFRVSKAGWIKKLKKQDVLFDIINPGGVKEYIPKILVTGPYNSGKSTFTHAISTRATSVDRLGTTVALDYGHVNYKRYAADVFGTPGQARFDPLLKNLGHRAIGLFLVVDSTRPETFARAGEMIMKCRLSHVPHVIIANKRDLKGALSLNQIRKKLSISSELIVPCVAIKKKGVEKALEVLFREVERQ